MRMPEVKRQIEAAILAERERCAKIAQGSPAYFCDGFCREQAAEEIRAQPRPSITILRPETAIQYPEKVTEHTIVAGQALIGEEIVDRFRMGPPQGNFGVFKVIDGVAGNYIGESMDEVRDKLKCP